MKDAWKLAGAVLVIGALAFLAARWVYVAKLDAAIAENNVIADTATARLDRLEDNGQLVGSLWAHLGRTTDRAVELWGDSAALDRENRRLGRELSTAQTSIARLEVEIPERGADTSTVEGDTLRAHFAERVVSRGDTIGVETDVKVPLASPRDLTLAQRLTATLTVDTRFVWEGDTPICQVAVRHEAVTAVPGRCIEALGTRPPEVDAARLNVSVGTGAVLIGGAGLLGLLIGLIAG